jgi:hypothetical protein
MTNAWELLLKGGWLADRDEAAESLYVPIEDGLGERFPTSTGAVTLYPGSPRITRPSPCHHTQIYDKHRRGTSDSASHLLVI